METGVLKESVPFFAGGGVFRVWGLGPDDTHLQEPPGEGTTKVLSRGDRIVRGLLRVPSPEVRGSGLVPFR